MVTDKCPICGHREDEHMAGDIDCGICFMCQRAGKECKETALHKFASFGEQRRYERAMNSRKNKMEN